MLRNPVERTSDERVVGLVHEIFAGKDTMHGGEPPAHGIGTRSVVAKKVGGTAEPCQGQRHREEQDLRFDVLQRGLHSRQRQERLEIVR